jgi:DNA-binding response OmpR family regulator
MLVFVVEREEKTASFLSAILQEAGFKVCLFREWETTLRASLDREPALIILDEADYLKRLSILGSLNSIRKIVLSARTAEGEKVQALESGADDYITKPFSAREFVARLRAVLRTAQTQLPANNVLGCGTHPSLQISAHQVNQIFGEFCRRRGILVWGQHVQADVIFEYFRHQAVDATTNVRQQHEHIRAIIT